MIEITRRVVLAVLVLWVASSLAADSYHPDLAKSQVVTLDARTIEAKANNGKPFDLDLGETQVVVVLAPAPVWPEEGLTVVEVTAGGAKKRLVTGNITYAGEVVGEDPATTEVRFTIARGVLEGYVLTSTDWWFIEPLARFDPKAGLEQYLVYAAHDFDAADYTEIGVKADRVIDYDRVFTDPYIPLAWIADKEYIDQSGPAFEWIDRQAALLNDLNGIFKAQTGREFKSRRGAADPEGLYLTSTDPEVLLDQTLDFIELGGGLDDQFESDVAHLTTGKDLNGAALGAAWRRNRYGLSQQSTTLAIRNMIVAARALGSNYDAGSEQAVQWCGVPTPNGCILFQTIMHPLLNSNTFPRFSDGTIDPTRNNVALICAEMALRGFPCLP